MRSSAEQASGDGAAPRRRARVRPPDAFLALAALAALLADPLLLHKISGLTPAMVVLALAAALPLLARTRFPLAVLAIEVPLLLGCLAVSHPNRAATAIVMLLVFGVGLEGGRVRSLVVGAVMALVVPVTVFFTSQRPEPYEILAYTALVVAALIAGEALRARQALQRALIEEAATVSEAAAQHRFDTERLALAHELHDAIGHTLVGINVRAAAAARRGRKSGGDDGLTALEEIASASSGALAELRATLKALRVAQDGPVPLHPVQELAGLSGLIAGVEEAGLSVDLEMTGTPGRLPAPVGHAVYRIVQEGLTNVLRHSTARHARVRVAAAGQAVLVEILDAGEPHPSAGPAGHGLRGMRERAVALGGSCEAGPVDGTGWRVRARIPVRALRPGA